MDQDKAQLQKDLAAAKGELDALRKEQATLKRQNEEFKQRLSVVDGHVQGVMGKKDEDLDAYRKKCLELEQELKQKDDKITDLQGQVVRLSNEVAEKEMEIEFYSNSLEEAQRKPGPVQPMAVQGGFDQAEGEKLKAKLRQMQRREVELQEEIERLRKEQMDEKTAQGMKKLLDRSRSRGRADENSKN